MSKKGNSIYAPEIRKRALEMHANGVGYKEIQKQLFPTKTVGNISVQLSDWRKQANGNGRKTDSAFVAPRNKIKFNEKEKADILQMKAGGKTLGEMLDKYNNRCSQTTLRHHIAEWLGIKINRKGEGKKANFGLAIKTDDNFLVAGRHATSPFTLALMSELSKLPVIKESDPKKTYLEIPCLGKSQSNLYTAIKSAEKQLGKNKSTSEIKFLCYRQLEGVGFSGYKVIRVK